MKKALYTILLVLACLAFNTLLNPLMAQKYYIGSSQFFDISGQWINENPTKQLINTLEINTTIVKTYRCKAYYSIAGVDQESGNVPIEISEKELAYTAELLNSKCIITPVIIDNRRKLKIYRLVLDPGGMVTDITCETFIRINEVVSPNISTFFSPTTELPGYWVNEWEDNQIIPRFQIMSNGARLTNVKVYRQIDDKQKSIGEFPIRMEPDGKTHLVQWSDGDVEFFMNLRPIRSSKTTIGIDAIIQEKYADGTPKGLFRQFFVADPDARMTAASEKEIQSLEGEWENVVPTNPTTHIVIRDGDATISVKCAEPEGCPLGTKTLKFAEEKDMLSVVIPSVASIYTIDIDSHLDVNAYMKNEKPAIIVVTTKIEDVEGEKEPVLRTEIFTRKGVVIPPEAFGLYNY